MTLPIFNTKCTLQAITGSVTKTVAGSTQVEEKQVTSPSPLTNVGSASANENNDQSVWFPTPCILDILFAKWGGVEYGLCCVGFVENVKVVLRGPWLQGSTSSTGGSNGGSMDELRNLPSVVDYEFTFIHQPGYTNQFQGGTIGADTSTQSAAGSSMALQVMANDVYQRLYSQSKLDQLVMAKGKTFGLSSINAMGNPGGVTPPASQPAPQS